MLNSARSLPETKPGRTSSDEIIIFDSTGMALQDVITAATVYKKAVDKGIGRIVDLAE
jgi:alanine dehydrogenase